MRYRESTDPFLNNQPEAAFVDALAGPYHNECPKSFGKREREGGELELRSVSLSLDFSDKEGLLATAYEDLSAFFECYGIAISDSGVKLTVAEGETVCREAYNISVSERGVMITAADTEGIRRAIYYIEDEMIKRGGPFLPLGEISRKPFIKSRISRCFFSPPSHASNEGKENELVSDVDYYPEGYLNRLAHDGVNGLWIGASLHQLLKSELFPEYGKNSDKMLAKLSSVVKRCKRYGIGVYVLSVEPGSGYSNPAFEDHPEYHGPKGWGDYHLFCPSTDGCEQYIKGAMSRLFSAVPELSGFINISSGECLSGCGSAAELTCPRCKKKYGTLARTLAATEKMLADAIHATSPSADFISWTYSQRVWERDDVLESCEARHPSVVHMQNFEDLGRVEQLGEERIALDYWLSYVGPGEVMRDSLEINRRRGIRTFAKLQVCSSHEISTIPYIPVPGILYDKYSAMRRDGIDGAVMCWYFGNYPGLMNKAACHLSFEPFPKSKSEFISELSAIYWGRSADVAAKAYEKFEEGYKNYPVSQSFEWFGPMQDSPAAPLHLIPVDLPMPSTWLTKNMVGGDRIGECLTDGHTLTEARILADRMSKLWSEGASLLALAEDEGLSSRAEETSVAEAIDLLFESGKNILSFYELRHKLGCSEGDSKAILISLKEIVNRELRISERLAVLCEKDSRLGYHPEACGYKFFPEKLRWRIERLKADFAAELSEVEKRIDEGKPPLGFYVGEGEGRAVECGCEVEFYPEGCFRYSDGSIGNPLAQAGSCSADGEPEFRCTLADEYFAQPKTRLSYAENDGIINIAITLLDGADDKITIKPEFHLFHPAAHMELQCGELHIPEQRGFSLMGDRLARRRAAIKCEFSKVKAEGVSWLCEEGAVSYKLSFRRAELGMSEGEPFRMDISRSGKHNECLELADRKFSRLIQGDYSPDSFALFIKR